MTHTSRSALHFYTEYCDALVDYLSFYKNTNFFKSEMTDCLFINQICALKSKTFIPISFDDSLFWSLLLV